MRPSQTVETTLGGRPLAYRRLPSPQAKRLRVRVGTAGVSVVVPRACDEECVEAFLVQNQGWIWDQVERLYRVRSARRDTRRKEGAVLFRGESCPIRVVERPNYRGNALVRLVDGEIEVVRGPSSSGTVAENVERWMRREAKRRILAALASLPTLPGRQLGQVFLKGQRTKWGSCSARGNLSFNWRLVMAPDYVLRYMVAHELAHLAIPDHSPKFWLTVQSWHPETERARQWLCRYGTTLFDFSGETMAKPPTSRATSS